MVRGEAGMADHQLNREQWAQLGAAEGQRWAQTDFDGGLVARDSAGNWCVEIPDSVIDAGHIATTVAADHGIDPAHLSDDAKSAFQEAMKAAWYQEMERLTGQLRAQWVQPRPE